MNIFGWIWLIEWCMNLFVWIGLIEWCMYLFVWMDSYIVLLMLIVHYNNQFGLKYSYIIVWTLLEHSMNSQTRKNSFVTVYNVLKIKDKQLEASHQLSCRAQNPLPCSSISKYAPTALWVNYGPCYWRLWLAAYTPHKRDLLYTEKRKQRETWGKRKLHELL